MEQQLELLRLLHRLHLLQPEILPLLCMCLPGLLALCSNPRGEDGWEGSWGIPLMKKLYWEASWTFCVRNCVWRVIFCCGLGFYFFLIFFFCGSLNCLLRKEELVEELVMLPGVCWFRAALHLLLAILIQGHLSVHNSVLRFFSLFFLFFCFFPPLSLPIYFFLCILLALCNRCEDLIPLPLKSIAKFLSTSLTARVSPCLGSED